MRGPERAVAEMRSRNENVTITRSVNGARRRAEELKWSENVGFNEILTRSVSPTERVELDIGLRKTETDGVLLVGGETNEDVGGMDAGTNSNPTDATS